PSCSPPQPCVVLEGKGQQLMAWDPEKQACVACGSCAGVEGATGRLWPVTADGGCLCETKDGYYFDDALSARAPRAFHADGAGWAAPMWPPAAAGAATCEASRASRSKTSAARRAA